MINWRTHFGQYSLVYSCSAGDSDIGGNAFVGLSSAVASPPGADVFRLGAPLPTACDVVDTLRFIVFVNLNFILRIACKMFTIR